MDKIQLLYAKNIISRKKSIVQQTLNFFMLLEHVNYEKHVEIIWSGEDGIWHTLTAEYYSHLDEDREYWHASVSFPLSSEQSLPGNIKFSLRYSIAETEYWDNNSGHNYFIQADSGYILGHHNKIQNVEFGNRLKRNQKSLPVTLVIDSSVKAKNIVIHWTTDDWQQTHKSYCHAKINYWDKKLRSNARNPNQYGYQVWKGHINSGNAYRIQYCIACETHDGILWENNFGRNYSVRHEQLKFLILNLHCNQEDDQDEKFTTIAKAIDENSVDIVCFQEVAENWNDGHGDWESNTAKIINDRLESHFHIYTDWSHLGFERYREGVAILSRFPLTNHESRYLSGSHDIYSIHSRKVIMAQVDVPFIGLINVFSVHLSWWENGFREQFEKLSVWAKEKQTQKVKATLLCGDFNITAGSEGYQQVVDKDDFKDQYLIANNQGLADTHFRVSDPHWQHLIDDDYRIDYIFMHKDSLLRVTSATVIFTDQDYGRVSDHCGYLIAFEPK